jgi:bile acid-coenzyme A ligase
VIDGQSWRDHPGSVGQFFSGRGKVLDCEGQPVPFGTMGELWVQASAAGDPVFSYVGSTPRERDGWYSFGDLAAMDAEGHVYIADRRHDLIIRGGTNIYPAELEAALEAHEAIAEAVVIGLPDDDMGARVHAILRTKSGTPIDEDSLFAFLRSRLASYKQPQSIEFVTDALRDNAGKLRRSEFRAQRLPRTG